MIDMNGVEIELWQEDGDYEIARSVTIIHPVDDMPCLDAEMARALATALLRFADGEGGQ